MRNSIKIALFILLVNLTAFGQTTSNKIIFLNDFYTTFIEKLKGHDKSADSIYKENIQTAICNNYFQKSEYGYIVKDFFAIPTKNTTELKKSMDRIILNKELIITKINGSLKKSNAQLKNDSLTIYVMPANPEGRQTIEQMKGVMGLTAGSKQIILAIEPDIAGWENMVEYAVTHEFNHAYWTNMNFGKSTKWTLLDYLVFEGRGDSFAHMLYPNVKAPWTYALNEKEITDLWNKIKPKLQSEDISFHVEVMFGSRNYPLWGGYTLGYTIVQLALKNTKLKAENWANLSSEKILEMSKYK